MGLSGINLNHLAALDALLVERNVRRAANLMGVTQSAMSHTLRALREYFEDPLLVRVGNDMVLTPLADGLQARLRAGLSALEAVARGRASLDPASIADEFTLAIHDGTATALVGPLHRRLRAEAPRARLHLTTVDPATLPADLRSGATDAALVPPVLDLSGLECEPLGAGMEMVVIFRRDHPRIGRRLSLDEYCRIPHATVSLGGAQSSSYVDDMLEQMGRSRSLVVRVAYVSALAEVLESSDLLALVPRAAAESLFCKRWELRYVDAPFDVPRIPSLLVWHGRFSAEPAQRFFRDVVRGAVEEVLSHLVD